MAVARRHASQRPLLTLWEKINRTIRKNESDPANELTSTLEIELRMKWLFGSAQRLLARDTAMAQSYHPSIMAIYDNGYTFITEYDGSLVNCMSPQVTSGYWRHKDRISNVPELHRGFKVCVSREVISSVRPIPAHYEAHEYRIKHRFSRIMHKFAVDLTFVQKKIDVYPPPYTPLTVAEILEMSEFDGEVELEIEIIGLNQIKNDDIRELDALITRLFE
jgi:hypothetical protein